MSATTTTSPQTAARDEPPSLTSSSPRYGEKVILGALAVCGGISILTTVGIVIVLAVESSVFFRQSSIVEFLTGTQLSSNLGGGGTFGVLPLVTATLVITVIAMVVAAPLGLAAAIYLSEYAPERVRSLLKPILEILAGIPTLVLGLFALNYVTPFLTEIIGQENIFFFNMLSPGLVMGIMIVPTVASLSEDALSAVPRGLRESSFGLGATKRKTTLKVVVPAALSGIVAAVLLGFGRAIGETMIVAVAAGALPDLTFNPLKPAQPMTGYIVQRFSGESPRGTPAYQSIFAVGALLFVMTFSINLYARKFVERYREMY
ncbi:MAG: phosphate ABC transporter permease subunit PstC [Egibacteraceae bacterium]